MLVLSVNSNSGTGEILREQSNRRFDAFVNISFFQFCFIETREQAQVLHYSFDPFGSLLRIGGNRFKVAQNMIVIDFLFNDRDGLSIKEEVDYYHILRD